jgi:hypothetical protein
MRDADMYIKSLFHGYYLMLLFEKHGHLHYSMLFPNYSMMYKRIQKSTEIKSCVHGDGEAAIVTKVPF